MACRVNNQVPQQGVREYGASMWRLSGTMAASNDSGNPLLVFRALVDASIRSIVRRSRRFDACRRVGGLLGVHAATYGSWTEDGRREDGPGGPPPGPVQIRALFRMEVPSFIIWGEPSPELKVLAVCCIQRPLERCDLVAVTAAKLFQLRGQRPDGGRVRAGLLFCLRVRRWPPRRFSTKVMDP